MTKQLSITVSDHTYETYLNQQSNNRSAYIEKLIIVGSESIINQEKTNKAELIRLIQENQSLQHELRQTKLKADNYKFRLENGGMDEEGIANTKMAKAIKNSGFMRRL
jgi:hypothetical protein